MVSSTTSFKISKSLLVALILLCTLLAGLLLWSALAPLESAAVTQGKVMVSSYEKVIQHLEGGIVKKINVREGSIIKKNEILIELDQTQARTTVELLTARYYGLLTFNARLIAERDYAKTIAFPEEVLKRASQDSAIRVLIATQEKEFKARRERLEGMENIYRQRIAQLNDEISSLRSQVQSSDDQLKLINKEMKAVAEMTAKKYLPDRDLYRLQREAARLTGDRDERIALIARAKQRIGEANLQMIQQKNEDRADILSQLRDNEQKLLEIEEQKKGADDVLIRTIIKAPQSGKVIDLKVHTLGAVIRPGDTIMKIIPVEDQLVIEAKVNPLDIDVVKKGLPAKVRLTSYKMRTTPTYNGRVIEVSADALTEPETGRPYYLARVIINQDELAKNPNIHLYPGMPVQVMIITNKQSFLTYLLTPLKESLHTSFREQ